MGSVTAITNASAQVVWKSEYQPFGTTAGIQGTYEFDGGYTGKDVDDATGLIYMWHRWQDPSTGSFISEDPAQDGNNWYSYCDGNPLNFIDSSGLKIIQISNQNRMSNGYWAENQLGHGGTEGTKFQASGCLITSMSQIMSALNAPIDPKQFNDANIDGFGKKSESDDGGNFDQRIFGKKNSDTGLIHNRWNRAAQGTEGLKGIIGEIQKSDKDFAIIGKFEFPHADGTAGSHYMPINGISDDGKYAIINPSSVNDQGDFNPKYRDGWYEKDGKIYVPITKLQSIDTYRKINRKEAWDKFWKGVGDALSGKKPEPEKKPAIEEEDNTTESKT